MVLKDRPATLPTHIFDKTKMIIGRSLQWTIGRLIETYSDSRTIDEMRVVYNKSVCQGLIKKS